LPFKLKRIGKISIKESLVKGKMAIAKRTVNGKERKLLFVGVSRYLHVYDISQPAEPQLLLRRDYTGDKVNRFNGLFEVIQSGNYLVLTGSYWAGGNPKGGKAPFQVGFVQVLDISDEDPERWRPPEGGSSGRWASFWEDTHSWTCSDVELEGEVGEPRCYLHVSGNTRRCDHLGGCLIIDLSDPSAPRKRGDIKWAKDGKYMGHGVTYDGRYQYHGNYYMGLFIVDYNDPDDLKVVAKMKYSHRRDATRSVVKIGNYLYATITVGNRKYYHDTQAGVATIDVSDPSAPKLVSNSPVPIKDRPTHDEIAHDAPPHKIYSFQGGKYLLINLGASGLGVYDVRGAPAQPKYLGLVEMDEVPRGTRPIAWDDGIMVIGDGPNFLKGQVRNKDNFIYIFAFVAQEGLP